jgi:hypothetical protein
MKTQQFLEHHGIASNPFAEEDAQTDPVFKEHCIASAYHPTWDKVYGDPQDPATAVVFGEKGSGKTAMRLQIVRHLSRYNESTPNQKVFVIEYDDFNPFLDRFRQRVGGRSTEKLLAQWKLWDHMDAILSLGVTTLIDGILGVKQPSGAAAADVARSDVSQLDRHQVRDLLVLAASYDQSTSETAKGRWSRLRKKLRFRTWRAQWDLAVGLLGTLIPLGLMVYLGRDTVVSWLQNVWIYLIIATAWLPFLRRVLSRLWLAGNIARNVRVGRHDVGVMRQSLMNFTSAELAGQPFPNKQRTDDRYELLAKFQAILKSLGFSGILVLVDRVDEPHLINGSVDQMRALLWPMLDNKFLKHPGVGFKLLLPIELSHYIDREDREFYQRARLDKQNLIPSLEWTGEALYDLATSRIKACAAPGQSPSLTDLFEPAISQRRIIDAFRGLRVPRHLFKFFYRLLVAHCNAYTDEAPSWKISPERFESVLALYSRDQEAFDRGLRAG